MEMNRYDAVKIEKAAISLMKRRKTLEKLQKLAQKDGVSLNNLPEEVQNEINKQDLRSMLLKDTIIHYLSTSSSRNQNIVPIEKIQLQKDIFEREYITKLYPETAKFFLDGYGMDELRIKLVGSENKEGDISHGLENVHDTLKCLYDFTEWVRNNKTNKKLEKINRRIFAENLWIVSKWNSVKSELINSLSSYRFDLAFSALSRFVSNDVGSAYLKFLNGVKQADDDPTTFLSAEYVLKQLCVYMSSFAPLMSVYAYSELKDRSDIMLLMRAPVDRSLINTYLEDRMDKTIKIAEDVNRGINLLGMPSGKPISRLTLLNVPHDSIEESVLKRLTSSIEIGYNISEDDFSVEINPLALNSTYSQDEVTKIIGKFLELTKGTIFRNLSNGIEINTDEKKYVIPINSIKLKPTKKTIHVFDGTFSKVIVDLELNERSAKEWVKEEIIRAIERVRDEMSIKQQSHLNFNVRFSDQNENLLGEQDIKDIELESNGSFSEDGRLLRIQNLNIDKYTIIISVFK